MTTPHKAYLEALETLPRKHRVWLEAFDIELFAYYGWGVVLNSAQVTHLNDVLTWPPGSIHVWRWANRTGKTTGLDLLYAFVAWYKWRFEADDFERDWLPYNYKVLHAAPLGELAGKAWGLFDELIDGRAYQQRDPINQRQRPALLAPFYHATKLVDVTDVDRPVVQLANGSQIDFRSTQGGAGRLESDNWWLIGWDEFPRQQPYDDIPLIFDQTLLPRSSDFMAPLILAGTATVDSAHVYSELEDIAQGSPSDWNFTEQARTANFSQSKASIDRQRRLSIDKDVAARSVDGTMGGGANTMFPPYVLDNAFDDDMPERIVPPEPDDEAGWAALSKRYTFIDAFDAALARDDNVYMTVMVPWPPSTISPANPILGANLELLRGSRSLTPNELQGNLARVHRTYRSRADIVDSTGMGGLGVYRTAREAGLPAVDCLLQARAAKWVTNKDYALQGLQRMLVRGLEGVGGEGFIDDWPVPDDAEPWGLFRFPKTGPWRKLYRQMSIYRRVDEKLRQDTVMTLAMLAWYMWRLVGHAQSRGAQPFNIVSSSRTRGRRIAVGRRR